MSNKQFSDAQRQTLIEQLADQWTEAMSIKDLERFFQDAQVDYLGTLRDDELIDLAHDSNVDIPSGIWEDAV